VLSYPEPVFRVFYFPDLLQPTFLSILFRAEWHDIIIHIFDPKQHFLIKRINTMGNLLYVIAVILIIGWAIGFFGYHTGGIIHVLLVIAIVAFLLKVISRA
jgi:hypothetical protein